MNDIEFMQFARRVRESQKYWTPEQRQEFIAILDREIEKRKKADRHLKSADT